MQPSTPDNKPPAGIAGDGSATTISAAPQLGVTPVAQGYAFGGGGGQGTMAEQQRRAHLYVGNLSPRVTEQSKSRGVEDA